MFQDISATINSIFALFPESCFCACSRRVLSLPFITRTQLKQDNFLASENPISLEEPVINITLFSKKLLLLLSLKSSILFLVTFIKKNKRIKTIIISYVR